MKKQILASLIHFLSLSLLLLTASPVFGQSAAISYKGQLTASGTLATGPHDMQFKLFDTAAVGSGAQKGSTIANSAVPVANGIFTVTLDFGGAVFDGSPRFLEIGVKPGGSTIPYTTLAPRQQVASIPYAIQSLNAATAATALTVASGSVVKSLNNLKDNVTLAAGANVTITPSGNTLTIASTGGGGGGSSLWSLAGANAYYNTGNVGIGTSTPANKLTVRTPTLGYGIEHTDGDIRLSTFVGRGIGYLGTLSNHKLTFFANDNGFPNMTMTLDTAGAVGIGTDSPTAGYRLEVNGSTLLRPANGTVQFGSPNAELGMSITPTLGNRADLRFDGSILKLVASAGVVPPSAANGLAITTDGNVGIGASPPTAGYKLEVNGATLLRPANGTVQFGSPNAELGLSITPTAGNRADLRFDGSTLKLVAGPAGGPPSSTNGIAITTAGNVGIGTTTPVTKLHVETSGANLDAVYGNATGTIGRGVVGNAAGAGAGVYGRSATGPAIHADGNATQARDKGGFVKAMAYIDPFLPATQYVVRSYNSQPGATITVTRYTDGQYTIDFGFNVADRFISLTPQTTWTDGDGGAVGSIESVFGGQVKVYFEGNGRKVGGSGLTFRDTRFHIVVY